MVWKKEIFYCFHLQLFLEYSVPHAAFLPPDDTYVPISISSFGFLSSLPFIFGACHWPWSCLQTEHSKIWYFWMPFNIPFLWRASGYRIRTLAYICVEFENALSYISAALICLKGLRIFDCTLRHLTLTINRWMDSLFV